MNETKFEPYVPAKAKVPEFTLKAVILGALFGILFGAITVYLGLKVGFTVSASIPIAVLAISLIKKFGHSTILENNIVQTIGSAGESIAAGVVFTIPALLFLSHGSDYFHYFQIFVLALVGGLLGVLFMVPLRRALIVQEHHKLPFPEGTACANVLIAGEKGGSPAKKVYYGIGIAFIYKLLMSVLGFWKDTASYIFSKQSYLPNANIRLEVVPELLGVGYIIGPRIAGIMVAGGVLSNLVLIPLITFIGEYSNVIIPPATKLISEMSPAQIWSQYIRNIGVGAVVFGGIITMIKSLPTIVASFTHLIHYRGPGSNNGIERTDRDLPLSVILLGSIALVVLMVLLPNIPVNALTAVLVLIAGFFFVTVSSRIVGLIGTSANPTSGMTIVTLMGTCLILIAKGWTDDFYQPVALCVGAIVAIAVANAGATSQDLKTGFLVGATPIKQQIGMMIGVVVSVFATGYTLMLLNSTLGFGEVTYEHPHSLPAPQATLMATIIKEMLNQNLPWDLVLIGMGIALIVELCGVSSLAFAIGTYLPIATTAPIFVGGLIRWFVQRKKKSAAVDHELESGTLFSSGLIAGGSIAGIIIAVMLGTMIGTTITGHPISLIDLFNTGFGESLGSQGEWLSLFAFVILGVILYAFAIKKDLELGN